MGIRTPAGLKKLSRLGLKSSNGDDWKFAVDGKPHRHVGLGPCHSFGPASCALDSVLVMTLLLGISREDFNFEGDASFGPDFANLLTHFWGPQNGLPARKEAKQAAGKVKEAFWAKFRPRFGIGPENFVSASLLWSRITPLIPRLATTQVTVLECPTCKGRKERRRETNSYELTNAMLRGNQNRIQPGDTALQAILSHVTTNESCPQCQVVMAGRRTWPNGPPAVLSVGLPPGMRIAQGAGSTWPFQVWYQWKSEISNRVQTSSALYVWRGGIYAKDQHFRVYFGERGHPQSGPLLKRFIFYDGMQLRGSIVGDVEPQGFEEHIPMMWQEATMLLFERCA